MFNQRRKIENKQFDPFVLKTDKFKYGKLEKYSHFKSWIEDSFIYEGRENEIVGSTFNLNKLKFFGIFLFLAVGLLLSRVAYFQVEKGDYYRNKADGNRLRNERIEPRRGVIYDRNKRLLVRNIVNFMLYLTPIDLPREEKEKEKLFDEIAFIIHPDDEEKRDDLTWTMLDSLSKVKIGSLESYQPLFIIDNIEYKKAMELYLKLDKMPGIVLSNKSKRHYLNEDNFSLSHILGYTGKINQREWLEKKVEKDTNYKSIDYIGKTGIEYSWEDKLKGISGDKKIEVDALGHEKKVISRAEAIDGYNLVLSIDYDFQKKVEEIVNKYLRERGLSKASIVAMNPDNGEILSLVSLPSFNNNVFARGITNDEYKVLIDNKANPLFNRAIKGEYPSGSVIKPVIAIAALEEHVVSENTKFLSNGGIRIGQWYFPDWRAGGHGMTDVRKAIAQSVNTYFYYIGGGKDDFVGLGVDRIDKYLELFGIGEKTGIDIVGESTGFIPTREWKEKVKKERWYIGDTYHLAIGQGDLLVTPLQVADFTSVFANRGRLVKPHLVKSVLSDDNKIVKEIKEEDIRWDFLDSYNIEVIRQGMRQGVTEGSSRRLLSLPFTSAGKTGTAQWSSKKPPHAWWTGFAPYKKPEITLTVMIEEGKEGSDIAVKIAHDILEYYFKNRK